MGELHPGGTRRERADATGMTIRRQQAVLMEVTIGGERGVTVAEVMEMIGAGHGQVSSALGRLHHAGQVTRLKERRGGQEIYVLPGCAAGRKESPFRSRPEQRVHPRFHSDRTVMEAMTVAGLPLDPDVYDRIRKFLEALP